MGEGALWISSDGDDWMGTKLKTQKYALGFQRELKNTEPITNSPHQPTPPQKKKFK